MSEPVKVLPMAQLLRLAKEKQARERNNEQTSEQVESTPQTVISDVDSATSEMAAEDLTTPASTLPKIASEELSTIPLIGTVPKSTTVPKNAPLLYRNNTVVKSGTVPINGIVTEHFTRIPNGVLDDVLPCLKPAEQVVLMRLYRLSRGFNSETCRVGFNTLAKSCNISKSTTQLTIARLIKLGFLEVVGIEQGGSNKQERGTIYQVKLPAATVPRKTTVPEIGTVPKSTTNKESFINNTHTNIEKPSAVFVCASKYSLEECQRYAKHLQQSGQGIQNPGGYATKIFRTGEADDLITAFLNPSPPTPKVDVSLCPDCNGTGFWYPHGKEKGVARCKHQRLLELTEGNAPDA